MSEVESADVEVVEIEIDEDRIVGYLEDEDGVEVGILYKNDDGEEVEIYYDELAEEEAYAGDDDAVEMEIDPDAILYYFVDAKGRELGFAAKNDEGVKEEYWYPEEAVERFYLLTELEEKLRKASGVKGSASNLVNAGKDTVGGVVNRVAGKELVKTSGEKPVAKADDDDDSVTKDDLKDMFSTFKDVAIEGYAAISGVMDQVDDVRDSLDEINPKKRRQNRREKKKAEAAQAPATQTVVVQQPVVQAAADPAAAAAAAGTTPAVQAAPAEAAPEAAAASAQEPQPEAAPATAEA